jgi:hypothetical protein
MATDGTVAVARVIPSGAIEVRIRQPGGSFGPAVSLVPGGGEAPTLVAGPNGQIAAVWRVGWTEYAAVRPPGARSARRIRSASGGWWDLSRPRSTAAVAPGSH